MRDVAIPNSFWRLHGANVGLCEVRQAQYPVDVCQVAEPCIGMASRWGSFGDPGDIELEYSGLCREDAGTMQGL